MATTAGPEIPAHGRNQWCVPGGGDAPSPQALQAGNAARLPAVVTRAKRAGYLLVDRHQRTSSQPPTLYGFVPRTYCGQRVAALCDGANEGDGDPLDICVVSERPIERAEILLCARAVGGISTIDGGKADDKIVAVLENDNFWGEATDVSDLPPRLIERLVHYFATYKLVPGQESQVSVQAAYGSATAQEVVAAAIEDYQEVFGKPQGPGD